MTLLCYSADFLKHDFPGIAEGPLRLMHFWEIFTSQHHNFHHPVIQPKSATVEQVLAVHRQQVLSLLQHVCAEGGGLIDTAPTLVGPQSYEIALLAAGAAIEVTKAALDGEPAFAAVRPPGHHATPQHSMGFCLFNNVAIAARWALETAGLDRILIVDFDLHHGNGTQDVFYEDDRVLFISIHQHPIYPGTGSLLENGRGAGSGTTINVPLPRGAGDNAFTQSFQQVIRPAAERFAPQLILCSAGYDAHWAERDALGAGLRCSVAGVSAVAAALYELARDLCDGRIAGVLEGGYCLDAVAWGILNLLEAWSRRASLPDPLGPSPIPERSDDYLPRILDDVRALAKLDQRF
ncbi:MAG: histone deacetylase [Chloroflexi bacterium]|nr:histone deacetylase [Chloroflexota bacterium]